jgi:hypothetical protein
VFSDPGGSSTAGQKIPARDSESPEKNRPEGERPNVFYPPLSDSHTSADISDIV